MVRPVMRLEASGKRPWRVEQRGIPRRHAAQPPVAGARLLWYWISAGPWQGRCGARNGHRATVIRAEREEPPWSPGCSGVEAL